ncbi:MAG TPA: hypothetical protein VJT13_24365 [Xanthobacteraceae bacterium]|nr:hypothetical protein [Xanthobacteraceae bacterium]
MACILCALVSGHGHAAGSNAIRIGGWSGGPSTKGQSKQFEACVARVANPQGIIMSYSVDSQYRWRLTFSDPTWSFTEGYSLSLVLRLGDRNYLRGRAVVSGPQTLEIRTDDDLSLFSGLWTANRLQVTAGGLKFEFELISSNEVLSALLQCAMRSARGPRLKNAPPILVSMGPSIPEEARSFANEVLAYARIKDAQMLPPQQGAIAWKAGLITTSLDLIEPSGISGLRDLPFRILERDSRKCREGFFFAWALQDIDRLQIARAVTVCPGADATNFAYHIAAPRSAGGYYVLSSTMLGGGFGGVVQQQLQDMDTRLRAVVSRAASRNATEQPEKQPQQEPDEPPGMPLLGRD